MLEFAQPPSRHVSWAEMFRDVRLRRRLITGPLRMREVQTRHPVPAKVMRYHASAHVFTFNNLKHAVAAKIISFEHADLPIIGIPRRSLTVSHQSPRSRR